MRQPHKGMVFSYPEIAEAMGTTHNTVMGCVRREEKRRAAK